VLLCTTTNKAIDSLAEKICATCDQESVVAIGSPDRLGATSVKLTLDEKVKRHKSQHAWLDLCQKARFVLEAYTNIQQNALIEARRKDAEDAERLKILSYSINEQQVAASMTLEMGAAQQVASVKRAASSLRKEAGRSRAFLHAECNSNVRCSVFFREILACPW
jgi:AAA domain